MTKITDVNDAGKPAFTPGTWIAQGETVYALDETGTTNRFYINIQRGHVINSPRKDDRIPVSWREMEATARLIASAPMLLAALKGVMSAEAHSLHVGYDQGGNYVYADVVRLDDEAFRAARDAIKAAEGE